MKNRILLFLLLISTGFNHLDAQINEHDSLALVDLYQSTNGKDWSTNNNWLTAKPVSSWYGVTVSGNRVRGLLLDFNNLKGALPSSIGNLTAITSLSASFNEISGAIPDSIGALSSLEDLDMEYNKLSGSIPASFTNLTALELVSLNNNRLTGRLPRDVERLTNLEYFNVFFNRIGGTIPDGFGSIAGLTELYLNNNELTGIIPRSLGNLTGMLVLDLSHNRLTGAIPRSFSNFKELFVISLNNNELAGEVPFLTASSDINLNNNHLTQSVNLPVSGGRDYTRVDLRYNNFTFNGLEFAETKLPNVEYRFQEKPAVQVRSNQLTVSAGGTLKNNTYAWFRVGAAVPTIIKADSTFTPLQSGRYYAVIRNAVATRLTLTTDTVSFTVALADRVMPIAVSLSPNPVSNMLTVSGLDAKEDYHLTITDASGYVWVNAMTRKQSSTKIDVNRLKTGNFLLTISDKAAIKTVRFIKN